MLEYAAVNYILINLGTSRKDKKKSLQNRIAENEWLGQADALKKPNRDWSVAEMSTNTLEHILGLKKK